MKIAVRSARSLENNHLRADLAPPQGAPLLGNFSCTSFASVAGDKTGPNPPQVERAAEEGSEWSIGARRQIRCWASCGQPLGAIALSAANPSTRRQARTSRPAQQGPAAQGAPSLNWRNFLIFSSGPGTGRAPSPFALLLPRPDVPSLRTPAVHDPWRFLPKHRPVLAGL
jgi:hypothetical protein